MSLARYAGASQDNDWCTQRATVYTTRLRTGSQCNWCRMAVIRSHHLTPLTRRLGATFCT